RGLWIVLGVVGGLLVVGAVVVAVLVGRLIGSVDDVPDETLDAYRAACTDGDWQACDDLFVESPFGSDDERFGSTCGNRTEETWGGCVEEMAGGDVSGGVEEGEAYGDDAALDALWDACEGGDGEACDDLYWDSPIGSQYEDFGSTCGGTTAETEGGCSVAGTQTYGDDAELDALWDACAAGDGSACQDLYFEAPIGSEYETFGATCGGREERGNSCTD
ncbi:hypothetical protein, partial [Cellulomonas carbonis]